LTGETEVSDTERAEVSKDQGNDGFSSEWQRLAQADSGLDEKSPRDDAGLEDAPKKDEGAGQAGTPPKDEAAPSAEPASDALDDIWADVPEAARKAFEDERKAREQAEQVARTNGGRASKAERDAAELRARLTAPPKKDEQAPSDEKNEQKADELSPELKRVAEEYGDVAKPLVDEIVALRSEMSRLVAANASAEDQQKARDELQLKEYLAGEEQKLFDAHGDWQEVVVKPEFVAWVKESPRYVQEAIARNGNGIVDGTEAADIIGRFKEATGEKAPDPTSARRERQLEGGRAVTSRTGGAVHRGEGGGTYSSEWQRLAAEDRRKAAANR
jgi:hypothetical protein